MTCNSLDLTVQEVMHDAVIGAAMRADRIDPQQFEAMLRGTARELEAARPAPSTLAELVRRCRSTMPGSALPW